MKKTIQTILFAVIGIFLMWLVLRTINFAELKDTLSKARWEWLLLGLGVNIFSNLIRGIRWNMLIEPLGYRARIIVSWLAVQIGYFASLAIPRIGEVSRCAILQQYEDIPLDKSLGTVVTERLIDMLMLLLIVPLALVLQYDVFIRFIKERHWVNTHSLIFGLVALIAVGIIIVFGCIWLFRRYDNHPLIYKIKKYAVDFLQGVASIKHLKNPWLFIFYTVFIWVLYWLTSYFIFKCFGFSEHLTLLAALLLLATGTFGFVAPVQGGLGAYEFIAIATLQLYGLTYAQSRDYALVNHFGLIIAQIVLGVGAFILLPVFFRKRDLAKG